MTATAIACCVADIIGVAGSFGTTFGAHTGIGTLPILYYGNEEQKQKGTTPLGSSAQHTTGIVFGHVFPV